MVSEANIHETAAALQLSVGLLKRRARETARDGELSSPEMSVPVPAGPQRPGHHRGAGPVGADHPAGRGGHGCVLEARELIARAPDPEDGRRSILTITQAGERALRAGRNALTDLMTGALSRGFTPGEIEQLRAAAPLIERLAQLI